MPSYTEVFNNEVIQWLRIRYPDRNERRRVQRRLTQEALIMRKMGYQDDELYVRNLDDHRPPSVMPKSV